MFLHWGSPMNLKFGSRVTNFVLQAHVILSYDCLAATCFDFGSFVTYIYVTYIYASNYTCPHIFTNQSKPETHSKLIIHV